MVIVASILILLVLAGIVVGSVNNGAFRGHNYQHDKYHAIIKPAAQVLRAAREKAREESVISTIMDHWAPKVRRHENRQARDTARAARALAQGRNPARFIQRSIRRDESPNNPVSLRDREIGFITKLRESAKKGDPKAQRLAGRIHPKTGHTIGGLSGIGHRNPASHMPQIKPPKQKRSVPGAGAAGKAIGKRLAGKPRNPRRPPYDPRR